MAKKAARHRDIAILGEFAAQVVPNGARRLGLVVGIDAYDDKRIPNLRAAGNDARAIHELMVDPTCGLFDSANTKMLLDSDATGLSIKKELERLSWEARKEDEVWIYFAGHGVIHHGEHRLVPCDGEGNFLDSTSVKFADFASKIGCRRKIIFLDCCHSGATGALARSIHSVDELFKSYDGSGTITFCSSDGDEKSVELPDQNRGAFSYWLERGLRGDADTDCDGVVTSHELWDFVKKNVELTARQSAGIRQTPRVKFDASGSFPLSVNRGAIEQLPRGAAGIKRTIEILQKLLGWNDETHLTTDELQRAKALLESDETGPHQAAPTIRQAAEDFLRDRDTKTAVASVRKAIEGFTPAPIPPVQNVGPLAPLAMVMERAKVGDPSAQFELARRYDNGSGVEKDEANAAEWYRAAADNGHPIALFSLSLCHRQGRGVAKSESEAQRCLDKIYL